MGCKLLHGTVYNHSAKITLVVAQYFRQLEKSYDDSTLEKTKQ